MFTVFLTLLSTEAAHIMTNTISFVHAVATYRSKTTMTFIMNVNIGLGIARVANV